MRQQQSVREKVYRTVELDDTLAAAKALNSYLDPNDKVCSPRCVFLTPHNKDLCDNFMYDLFHNFEPLCAKFKNELNGYASLLFARTIQCYNYMVKHWSIPATHDTAEVPHILVDLMRSSAARFGITHANLSDFSAAVDEDFIQRNKANGAKGNTEVTNTLLSQLITEVALLRSGGGVSTSRDVPLEPVS